MNIATTPLLDQFPQTADVARCGAVAVLVDGDNLSADYAGRILRATESELGYYSLAQVYGDVNRLVKWSDAPSFRLMHAHAGKNVTDQLLTVEAMELSYGGLIDGFAIASRDRDFAPLAWSLRKRGFPVLCLAPERIPSDHFQRAAGLVAELGRLDPPQAAAPIAPALAPAGQAAPLPAELRLAISQLLATGSISLTNLGQQLSKLNLKRPARYANWASMIAAHPELAVRVSGTGTTAILKRI